MSPGHEERPAPPAGKTGRRAVTPVHPYVAQLAGVSAEDVALRQVPRLPAAYIARDRLWAGLDLAISSAVTVLVAPAGAGKSLGVAGWLRSGRELGGSTGRSGSTRSVTPRPPLVEWVNVDSSWTDGFLHRLLDGIVGGV